MQPSFLLEDVFCIPHEDRYIVYFPLQKTVLLANSALVNSLYQAACGDEKAFNDLDIDPDFLQHLHENGRIIREKMKNPGIPLFSPGSVSIFLTNKCTFRCVYCYAHGGARSNDMEWETVTGVLDAVLENVRKAQGKLMTVHFHGGGDISSAWPLLVKTREYLDSIAGQSNIKVKTSVATNGYLDRDQQQWIAAHINSATVSIDGIPEIQNHQRPLADGSGSFEFVDNTLKAFDKAGFPYGIRMTVSSSSVSRLEESVEFICRNYKAISIKAEPLFPRGRALDSAVTFPDAKEFVHNFRKARRTARSYRRRLAYSGLRPDIITPVFCQAAGTSCVVTPEGLVTSCYEVLSPDDPLMEKFCYGRFDSASGQFVIDEDKRKSLYGLSVFNKSFCNNCFCKYHCAGDCPVKSMQDTLNNAEIPDRCYITRELTKDFLVEALEGPQ